MPRSRALTLARLARAHLGQGEPEAAVRSAMMVPDDDAARHPRISAMLDAFTGELHRAAPGSAPQREWKDRIRTIRGRDRTE